MKGKKLRVLTEILAIIVICLVSFVGVYKQDTNSMKNEVKEYSIGKDIIGYRDLVFEVSDAVEVKGSDGKVVGNTDEYDDSSIEKYSYEKTENKVNPDEQLNTENYKKSKAILEQRLKDFGIQEYNFSLNNDDGTMSLQIPEDSEADHLVSNILQVADFKIKDSEDESKVFITNKEIKDVKTAYNTTETGTSVYLQIELNEEGKKILKDLSSNEYATKPEEETEENEEKENENDVEAEVNVSSDETSENQEENNETGNEENSEENNGSENEETSEEEKTEEEQKKIMLSIDNNEMVTTSFDQPIEDGIINLTMGKEAKDSEEVTDMLQSTSTVAIVLNSSNMPLTYKIKKNQYVSNEISKETLQKIIIVAGVILILALGFLIIKYKLRGLIASISYIGFIALDLLIVRYTNISILLESIVAGVSVLIINYILVYKLLEAKSTSLEEIKSWVIKLIPIFLISVFFVFVKWTAISTFGMFMFWGIVLSVIYNALLTKDMIQ